MMKCHYEILDVPKDADLAEIKSAYRKAALKWHPDKNFGNTDLAKEQFQLVQQAYEVLSDPHERSWYDKHREQILRGCNSEFQDNCLDVFQYFTTTCFRGYGDDDGGFYAVYRNVFDQIIKEDLEFVEDKELREIPRFGGSKSDYDAVVAPFYSYWTSYCTKKSYVWLDRWDMKEICPRKILKFREKENKEIRQKAKKERNEEVRNLVGFVRKRDKRVREHTKLVEAKILENRQRQEQLSRQKRLERKKQIDESEQAEWAKFDNVKSELEEIEKNLAEQFGEEFSNSEEENEEVNDLYCVACIKVFKTIKAFANHELSKKHKENVENLKKIMLEEEEEEAREQNNELDELQTDCLPQNGCDSDDSIGKTKKQKRKNKKSKNVLTVEDTEEGVSDTDLTKVNFDIESSRKRKGKNKRQTKNTLAQQMEANEEEPEKTKNIKKKQTTNEEDVKTENIDVNHCCMTCKSNFPSKNKLFDHLKASGHGVYLPKSKTKGTRQK